MRSTSKVMAGVVTLAMTGGFLLGASGAANAAYDPATPPYNGAATGGADPNNVDSLVIYNAATGGVVTSGSTTTPLNNYYFVAKTNFAPGQTRASLSGYLAEAGKNPAAFTGTGLGAATTYPVSSASAPAPISGQPNPTARGASTSSFGSLAGGLPNGAASTSDFYQLYQLRVATTFPDTSNASYAYMDVQIDTVNSTWRQVGPTPGIAAPATPATPTATAGNGSATVTVPAVPGATSYTATSSPGGFTGTSSTPSVPVSGLTNGVPYSFTVVARNAGGPSAASAASNSVTPTAPLPATATSLVVSGIPADSSQNVTLTSTTKTPDSSGTPLTTGTVQFTDTVDGPLGAPVPVNSSGVATLTRTFSAAPNHSVTATWTDSATPATYASSTSAPATFAIAQYVDPNGACADPASQCTDDQIFKAVVAQGTLVISTPYVDAASAFNLGTLTLNSTGTLLSSGAVPFGATGPVAAGGESATPKTSPYAGVTISDRRAGDLPWTAKVSSGDFVNGGNKIDAQNLGFTRVTANYITGNALNAASKPVVTTDNPAAAGVAPGATGSAGLKAPAKTFATAAKGNGSVYISGDMTLNAPTSTPAGTYFATVTFTIS